MIEIKNKKNGFTLFEILVVISLILIILGIAVGSSRSFSSNINLQNTTKEIGSIIKLAKSQSISALNGTHYGVHLDSSKVTIFEGDTFTDGEPTNKAYIFSKDVEIYNYNLLGGGDDIVFQRLIGLTNNSGMIDLRLRDDPTNTKQIVINTDGQISFDSFQTSTGSPIQNARHVHFDLGWNIEDVTTLRLEGLNPSEITDIDTTDYFNLGKTKFDWNGTINTDGIDQTLRIHSWLDGTTSILCVMREQSENDELKISFFIGASEKHIATYENNSGSIDIMLGASGGSSADIQ